MFFDIWDELSRSPPEAKIWLKNSDFLMKNRVEERKFAKIYACGGLQVLRYKTAKILLWSPPQAENFGDWTFSGKFPPLFFDISKQGGAFSRGTHVI